VEYSRLRKIAAREAPEAYRIFRIKKRPLPGAIHRYRIIVVPPPWLMGVQRWLNENVLRYVEPHESSSAFSKGNSIRQTAALHCGCRWLIKIDIENFFESVTEAQVYRVFERIGYQPLVSVELARLCTRIGQRETRRNHNRFLTHSDRWNAIKAYQSSIMGHLPQGAPTSPLLANLVAYDLDKALSSVAEKFDMTYTRYADDLCFSTRDPSFTRLGVAHAITQIYRAIAANGFTPNKAKTVVAPPGARKVVLGLLVDRETPRLTREFKAIIRQHLYYLRKSNVGPVAHAIRQGGATAHGLQRHLLGLIQYARQIEPAYGNARLAEFDMVNW
jgi:RNA-directed DNA polymerase